MTEEIIGHCIRIAMAQANINADALAKMLGCSIQTVYSYQKGKCPSIAKLGDVARACGTTYDELVTLSDKANQVSEQ